MKHKNGPLWMLAGLAMVCSAGAIAGVRLPSVFGDNMVLQQQSTVNLWGWADPGEQVRVSAGWTKAQVSAVAGPDGRWQAKLITAKAGGPYMLAVHGKNRILLKNVMLGEVWVCSGQSNMEFTIRMLGGWAGSFAADSADLVKYGYGSLRLFTVVRDTSTVPLDTCSGKWSLPDPEVAGNFSATAYFFGRELSRKLKVPVGLISSSWGGTPAEAWTPLEVLQQRTDLAFYLADSNKIGWFPARPGILYGSMIHPLVRFPIRGVIWYQGESNRDDAHLYRPLLGALISSWRSAWGLGDFPFYYVQIAPYRYDELVSGGLLREAQLKTMDVPNTGMVVTSDIGDVRDIHPKNKQEVGRRLALWAFARTYGINVPGYSGPIYRSMKREGTAIRLSFDHAAGGLVIHSDRLAGFSIAGPDRAFVEADAEIDGSTVIVSSPGVTDPVAVRFAFTDTSESKLFNRAGLPASPFRTDDWPIVTARVALTVVFDPSQKSVHFNASARAPAVEIRYTLDGSDPSANSPLYGGSVRMAESGTFSARAFKDGVGSSSIARSSFANHLAVGKPVHYAAQFDQKYPGGGRYALVDGVKGSESYGDGLWQGFKKNDVDVTIDLGDTLDLRGIRSGFLQDQHSWIFLPRSVGYSLSLDGVSFHGATTVQNDVPDSTAGAVRKIFAAELSGSRARFIRVRAINIGQCPSWHPGHGGDAWLFVDEITVN